MSLLGRTNSLRRNLLALLIASPWLIMAVVRILSLDRWWPLIPFVAFTPQTAAFLLALVVVALLLRARFAALIMAVAVVWLVVLILPRAESSQQPVAHGRTVRIFSANLLAGGANAQSLVADIRAADPDVIALQEAGPQDLVELRDAGLLKNHPYEAGDPEFGTLGYFTVSRWPITVVPGSALQGRRFPELRLAGTPILFRNVHPTPPIRAGYRTSFWRDALAAIPPPTGGPQYRIVSGDFNATLDHRDFRSVLSRGYHDSADQTGKGLDWTWDPSLLRRLSIDHILVDPRIAVESYHVYQLQNSDHNAISVTLRLP